MRLNHPHPHDRDLIATRTILSASGPVVAVVAAGDAGDNGACCPRWVRWQEAQGVNGDEGRAAEPRQRILPPAVRRLGGAVQRPAPHAGRTGPPYSGPVVQEGNTTQNLCCPPRLRGGEP